MAGYSRATVVRKDAVAGKLQCDWHGGGCTGACGRNDAVGTAPTTSAWSCPTGVCRQYIDAVDLLSKDLTDKWTYEVQLIEAQGDSYPLSTVEKIQFLEEFQSWINRYRRPWLGGIGKLMVDCDSTTPGPCREAIGKAEQHENAVLEWDKRFRAALKGRKKLPPPVKGVDPGGQPSSRDRGPIPQWAPSGGSMLLAAVAVGGLIWLAKS